MHYLCDFQVLIPSSVKQHKLQFKLLMASIQIIFNGINSVRAMYVVKKTLISMNLLWRMDNWQPGVQLKACQHASQTLLGENLILKRLWNVAICMLCAVISQNVRLRIFILQTYYQWTRRPLVMWIKSFFHQINI